MIIIYIHIPIYTHCTHCLYNTSYNILAIDATYVCLAARLPGVPVKAACQPPTERRILYNYKYIYIYIL